jgi:transcription initiation factor TFIIIB Brf1 subunit/transcription initiation factor TFIIB
MQAERKAKDICSYLKLGYRLCEQSLQLLDRYIEGKYASGKWLTLVIASCIYAACRLARKPITLIDIAVCYSPFVHLFLTRLSDRRMMYRKSSIVT